MYIFTTFKNFNQKCCISYFFRSCCLFLDVSSRVEEFFSVKKCGLKDHSCRKLFVFFFFTPFSFFTILFLLFFLLLTLHVSLWLLFTATADKNQVKTDIHLKSSDKTGLVCLCKCLDTLLSDA